MSLFDLPIENKTAMRRPSHGVRGATRRRRNRRSPAQPPKAKRYAVPCRDMSNRTIVFASPKYVLASVLATKVLPTPVGPAKMKLATVFGASACRLSPYEWLWLCRHGTILAYQIFM